MSQSYIATLISQSKNPAITEFANHVSSEFGVDKPVWLAEDLACDIELPGLMTQKDARLFLSQKLEGQRIDFAIQMNANRKKQALIADMDSTMIDQECIDELAAEVGVKKQVAEITAKAMNGEIEFASALRERVALLQGLASAIVPMVIEKRITLAKGGNTLISTMKKHGAWTALVSGGFTVFTQEIAARLGFDENHANILEVYDGKFTGTVREPILGAEAKVASLEKIAKEKGLDPNDFIAVGDGANDLPMLNLAGTGVALHAKPTVAEAAGIKVDHGDLTSLLYIQGYQEKDFTNA